MVVEPSFGDISLNRLNLWQTVNAMASGNDLYTNIAYRRCISNCHPMILAITVLAQIGLIVININNGARHNTVITLSTDKLVSLETFGTVGEKMKMLLRG